MTSIYKQALSVLNRQLENEIIANRRAGRIYIGNFQNGKYVSVKTYETHTEVEVQDVAILSVSPQIELRISYIANKDDLNGFRLRKIKQNRSTKQWATSGEISLSLFSLADLVGLTNLLSKLSLKDISQSRIDIEDIQGLDEKDLEKSLRTILATEVGRRMLTTISETQSVSDRDIVNVVERRKQLDVFRSLLVDEEYFGREKEKAPGKKSEAVWQTFFESNQWIFGYGLNLISCEGLSDAKLETIVAGASAFSPGGKRVDALLKTRGFVKSLMFCEIKTHQTKLMEQKPYRPPDTFQVSGEVLGAVSQVQKTIHKTTLKLTSNSHQLTEKDGSPKGEEVALAQPRGIVIVGSLSEFQQAKGVNYEQFAAFELYRRNTVNPEIITFDELYERAKFIVGSEEKPLPVRGNVEEFSDPGESIGAVPLDDIPF